jgi:4-amino-4-deoxychorismate lyase
MVTTDFTPWMGVFETLRVVKGSPLFVAEHLTELQRAMKVLGLSSDFDFPKAVTELPKESGRWRWVVTPNETRTIFTAEAGAANEPVNLSLSDVRVGSHNWDARFKTISHLAYAQAWQSSPTAEALLLNEHGQVASASRGNLFWVKDGQLYTPSHESGCRRGVTRGFVLQRRTGREGAFPRADLLEADEVFLTNSMRGIVSVSSFQGRTWNQFSFADALRLEYGQAIAKQGPP